MFIVKNYGRGSISSNAYCSRRRTPAPHHTRSQEQTSHRADSIFFRQVAAFCGDHGTQTVPPTCSPRAYHRSRGRSCRRNVFPLPRAVYHRFEEWRYDVDTGGRCVDISPCLACQTCVVCVCVCVLNACMCTRVRVRVCVVCVCVCICICVSMGMDMGLGSTPHLS